MIQRETIQKFIRRPDYVLAISLFVLGTVSGTAHAYDISTLPARVAESIGSCNTPERGDKLKCLDGLASELVRKFSFPQIDRALLASGADCHDLMHFVAQKEYRRTKDVARIYGLCSFSCFGACYHGGIEGYAADEQNLGKPTGEIAQSLISACPASNMYGQCVHGVGHALMLLSGDLFQSLKWCDLFPEEQREVCYGGTFMENMPSSRLSPHPPAAINPDDPLYPCSALDTKYQKTCYEYQVSHFNSVSGNDTGKVARLCNTVPLSYRARCFMRIGTALPGGTTSTARAACGRIADGTSRALCIRGVVDSFGDRFGGMPGELVKTLNFCAGVSDEERNDCFEQAGFALQKFLPRLDVQRQCEQVADPLSRAHCIRGISIQDPV